jgi:sortase A
MFNIWTQSNYPHDVIPKLSTTIVPIKLMEESTPSVKSAASLVVSTSHKPIYSVYPSKGDNIGSLTIPALKRKLPILQGTDDEELRKGVGHFTQSVLPGEEDNCVLSGHRDTVFRQLGELKIGDLLIVQTAAGTFTY